MIKSSNKPVCYLLNYPRPVGLEPTIYLTRPNLGVDESDVSLNGPTIIECYSFNNALSQILHFNIGLALNEFKIVT